MKEIDSWWASLTINEKVHIATKARDKGGDKVEDVNYPGCSRWWNSIDPERKEQIYEHCTDAHGLVTPDWQEGRSFSY